MIQNIIIKFNEDDLDIKIIAVPAIKQLLFTLKDTTLVVIQLSNKQFNELNKLVKEIL